MQRGASGVKRSVKLTEKLESLQTRKGYFLKMSLKKAAVGLLGDTKFVEEVKLFLKIAQALRTHKKPTFASG